MCETMCLSELRPGERARVCALRTEGAMRRRLLDLGLLENTVVTCVGRSPCGDPAAYQICGAVIALRRADSRGVLVRPCKGGAAWD